MFLSQRERTLWSLAAAVIAAIFLSLFVGPTFIGAINESVLLILFTSGMILVAITILTQGLRVRPGGIEVGIILGALSIFTLLAVRLTLPERSHLMEFGVLAVLVYEALYERSSNIQNTDCGISFPVVLASLICISVGLIDEGLQYYLPDRVFDWQDIFFNVLAATTAAISMALLRRVRIEHKQ